MKKQIPTIQEVIKIGEANGVQATYMHTRLMQNAVEISTDILSEMQDISGLGRDVLLTSYIEPWSREAEVRWFTSTERHNQEYLDYIQNFAQEKLKEFKDEMCPLHEEPKKKAKLVSFTLTTRVVVNENEMPECEEEDAIEKALEKIKANPDDYLVLENFEDIYDDEDCPYGSLDCDNEE